MGRRPSGSPPLNYRHAFHAGNFADLVKHALMLALLARLTRAAEPLAVFDTHAGAGLYDVGEEPGRRSGEAAAGVARLMAAADLPPALEALARAVRALNPAGATRLYPGSPWLAARALRKGDSYTGCELRPDDFALLRQSLGGDGVAAAVQLLNADGYGQAARALQAPGRTLLVIDPPFEQADDYARVAALIAARPRPASQPALIWTPLKDLETFDAFLSRLEAARPASLLAAQARLRRLDNPMQMNGCAVVLVDAPDLSAEAQAVCGWIAAHLGDAGARASVEQLASPAT